MSAQGDATRGGGRWLVLVVISILALSSCSSQPATSQPSNGTAHYAGRALSFDYPAGWSQYQYSVQSMFVTSIVDLSTEQLHDPCVRTPSSISCDWPLSRLGTGGVLVEWSNGGFLGWMLSAQKGTSTTIGSRPAKVRIETPGDCAGVGAQVTVGAYIQSKVADNWYGMLACINGPNTAATERQVMTMLSTVHVTEP